MPDSLQMSRYTNAPGTYKTDQDTRAGKYAGGGKPVAKYRA